VLARPTKSIARYLQAAGRVLRPHPSKVDAVLIDHTGAVKALGFVDDEQPWSLDGDGKIQDRKAKAAKKDPKAITCPACNAEFKATHTCPECGNAMHFQLAKAIKEVDADLEEVGAKESTPERLNRTWTSGDKERFYGELRFIARERGYKEGWAAMKYKERLSVFPNKYKHAPPLPPSMETTAWLRHLQIKYAKSKGRQQSAA
jgi:superfamily II DNA or RNA helicase